MYTLKRIYNQEQVTLPQCMYKLKVVTPTNERTTSSNHDTNGSTALTAADDIISQNISRIVSMEAQNMEELEKRQKHLLDMLYDLKKQLSRMASKADGASEKVIKTKSAGSIDLVIHASPLFIPYCLLAVFRKGNVPISLTCYLHSSVAELTEDAQQFQNFILKKSSPVSTSNRITLIWKEVGADTELICFPMQIQPILGEVNVLRFLAQQTSFVNSFGSVIDDTVLDLCWQTVKRVSVGQQQSAVGLINICLGRLFKKAIEPQRTAINLNDLIVFSTIKQIEKKCSLKSNANAQKQCQRLEKLFDFCN